jgi:periplasmic divalent cation tolerance protein
MDAETVLVYVTAGSREEALKIARALVEERLAACANVLGEAVSVYRWGGRVHEDPEVVMVAKTVADKLGAAVARVKELHGYECPCVVAVPIAGGNPDFLDWIGRETE